MPTHFAKVNNRQRLIHEFRAREMTQDQTDWHSDLENVRPTKMDSICTILLQNKKKQI